MNNVMLDLETFGTLPGSVIRSVGAVMFDPHGEGTGAEFYMNVDDASCGAAGLTKDAGTIRWWADVSRRRANEQLLKDTHDIKDACESFRTWFRKNGGVFLWSQGSNFDEVLMGCAMRSVKVVQPWKFSDARDTRTAYDISGFNSYGVKRAGTYHNALDDAKHQVLCVQRSYAKVKGRMV